MKVLLGMLVVMLFAGVTACRADSMWTYTGNATPNPLAFPNPCGCALSGTVTFDDSWNPLSWDFTDGTHELTQADSAGTLSAFYSNQQIGPPFRTWNIAITSPDGLLHMGTYNYGSGFEATDTSYMLDSSFPGLNVQGNSGVWSESVPAAEPATGLLVGLGLAVASLIRRRKKKLVGPTVWENLG